jgi:hypothetical protein
MVSCSISFGLYCGCGLLLLLLLWGDLDPWITPKQVSMQFEEQHCSSMVLRSMSC